MAKSIQEIKTEFAEADEAGRDILIREYQSDGRKGVRQLIQKIEKDRRALQAERERLEGMKFFEKKYASYSSICGIDEAGRGPFAGPVVAGAVILPKDCEILYLNDSKQVSAKKREELYDQIISCAVSYGIGIVPPERIDEINILQATYEAMKQAVDKLSVAPDLLLIDAARLPDVSIKQVEIVKGDEKSVSIAAASILAKVTRDRIMLEYDQVYPEYGFASHKGYGSARHQEAILKYGACPIHRRSFLKKLYSKNGRTAEV